MTNSLDAYKLFAQYYDLYIGSFNEDMNFYTSFCNKNDEIIEIGCGTGRILKHFLESGFHITGVDISDEMLEIAKKKLRQYELNGQLFLKNKEETSEICIETKRKYYSPSEIKKLLPLAGFLKISFSTLYNKEKFRPKLGDNNLKGNYIVKAEV